MRYQAMLLVALPRVFLFALIAVALLLLASVSSVQADDDHSDYRSFATPVDAGGGQVAGAIDLTPSGFDVDYFSFKTRRGGGRYTIVVELDTVEAGNLQVVNSMARGIESSDGQVDYQEGNKKTVEQVARTSDTYFVEVSTGWDPPSGQVFVGA